MTPETTTAIATVEGEKFNYFQRLGKLLAASGYFADVKDQAQAAVKVLAGDELGIPPIASMTGIYIVKGKIQLGATLIASRIRAHGYDYRILFFDTTKCVIEFHGRLDSAGNRAALGESSFTIADAIAAGIKSDMYAKYPRNMLFSRAISNGAKWFTPDVFSGIPVYAEGELAEVSEESEPPSIEHVSIPDPPKVEVMNNPPSFAEKLATYTHQKKRVGEAAYYRVLASHGFEHANEVVKRPLVERQAIYHELMALPDEADTSHEPAGEKL